ncbi:MAG: NAD(P)-dependent oxidoreductase [Gemmatimonas sp.]
MSPPPLPDASVAMLAARRLALLPPGAIVVNVARGGLIDDAALVAGFAVRLPRRQ